MFVCLSPATAFRWAGYVNTHGEEEERRKAEGKGPLLLSPLASMLSCVLPISMRSLEGNCFFNL